MNTDFFNKIPIILNIFKYQSVKNLLPYYYIRQSLCMLRLNNFSGRNSKKNLIKVVQEKVLRCHLSEPFIYTRKTLGMLLTFDIVMLNYSIEILWATQPQLIILILKEYRKDTMFVIPNYLNSWANFNKIKKMHFVQWNYFPESWYLRLVDFWIENKAWEKVSFYKIVPTPDCAL